MRVLNSNHTPTLLLACGIAASLCACSSDDASGPSGSTVSNSGTGSMGGGSPGAGGAGNPGGGNQPTDEPVGGLDLGYNPIPAAGTTGAGGADCEPNLTGIVRDFIASGQPMGHADFETFSGNSASLGIVQATLGADKKPVYAPMGPLMDPQNNQQTTTAEAYNQWYRDTPGVNESIEYQIQLAPGNAPGILTFDDPEFFPIDGVAFGNFDENHNFHFTFELHTTFTYSGGEVFTFTGDDDLWVFINDKLALDLGGLHPELSDTVDLDMLAAQLGITVGSSYTLDLFHAERHTNASHFRIDTSIAFTNCQPILIR